MKYPEMRKELIAYLSGLSNLQYQRDCWVNGNCPDGVEHDEFDYVVHFLFDDTKLSSNPKSLIGYLLKNESEAILIQRLCQEIERIFEKYGTNLSDEEYMACHEWSTVISTARQAHAEITKPI